MALQFQNLYERQRGLDAQVQTITSKKPDVPKVSTHEEDGEPRESIIARVMSFGSRKTLSEQRPPSFIVDHRPSMGSGATARKGSAGEAIANKFIANTQSGSFRIARSNSNSQQQQQENVTSLDIGDSSL